MNASDDEFNHNADPTVKELTNELAIIKKRLEIAEIQFKLNSLIRESPIQKQVPDVERTKVKNVQKMLAMALNKEMTRLGIDQPTHIELPQFTSAWVTDNWNIRLRYFDFSEEVPHEIVSDAMQALYQNEYDLVESKEALFEIHRNLSSEPLPELARACKQAVLSVRQIPVVVWYYAMGFLSWIDWAKRTREVMRISKEAKRLAKTSAGASESALFSPRKRAAEMRTERQHQYIQKIFSSISVVFSAAAAVFMFSMLSLGMVQLGSAIVEGAGLTFHTTPTVTSPSGLQDEEGRNSSHREETLARRDNSDHSAKNAHQAMQTSLGALEIILVAPLPYLLILALNRYIKALAYKEDTNAFRKELLEFKAFEVALFIAIIAASTVSQVLDEALHLEYAVSVALVIGVLAAYYFIVEHASKEAEAARKDNF
jgi:hypothetical protein